MKTIPGYEGFYSITGDGRVYSHGRLPTPGKTGGRSWPARWLKPKYDRDGYVYVILSKDGEQETKKIHRLVLEVFVGPSPSSDHVANHKNFSRDDNRVENLEWTTQHGNVQHSVKAGRHYSPFPEIRGKEVHTAKLDETQVAEIRRRRGAGTVYRELAEEFGVSISTIFSICKQESWKHVSP